MINVLLAHKRTGDEKLIQIPADLGFSAFLSAVRSHEPNRLWEIAESWEVFESF